MPLLFEEHGRLRQGRARRAWEIQHLHAIAEGEDELEVQIEGGETFTVTHNFLPREREIVVAGGLIRYLREQQPTPA